MHRRAGSRPRSRGDWHFAFAVRTGCLPARAHLRHHPPKRAGSCPRCRATVVQVIAPDHAVGFSPMSSLDTIDTLNRVLEILERSFPQYLRWARPYIPAGRQNVMQTIETIVAG